MDAKEERATSDTLQETSLQDELIKRGRDVWLAGLGALATVEEEGSKLFSNLVERGRKFEAERKKQPEDTTERHPLSGSLGLEH